MAHRLGGWTLLEVMIVLAIAAVLAAWGVPSLQRTMAHARLSKTSNHLIRDLHLARHMAMTTGRRTAICAGDISTGCTGRWADGHWIVFFDGNKNGQPTAVSDIIVNNTAAGKLEISGNGPFRKAVEFTPLGASQWPSGAFAAGRLRICTQARLTPNAREVVLAASGRVRTKQVDFNGDCPPL